MLTVRVMRMVGRFNASTLVREKASDGSSRSPSMPNLVSKTRRVKSRTAHFWS